MSASDGSWSIGFDRGGAPALVPAAGHGHGDSGEGPEACIPIPVGLPAEHARLIPRLARVLWAWDSACLELGECAIVTSGSADAALFCLVAAWRTGRTPIYLDLGDHAGPAASVADAIPGQDSQSAIEALTARIRPAPAAAAVVLSASVRAADLLLEVLPTWGRVLIGTSAMEPAAIDFYNHVHRKGARLQGVPATPMSVFEAALREAALPHIQRAIRILRHGTLATSCLQQAV